MEQDMDWTHVTQDITLLSASRADDSGLCGCEED
jgi:hypothetical protein